MKASSNKKYSYGCICPSGEHFPACGSQGGTCIIFTLEEKIKTCGLLLVCN
jgi:hypothetical protein